MTATLSMVPVAQIRPSKANPRAEFDDDRMAELVESVKQHGIITPLTTRPCRRPRTGMGQRSRRGRRRRGGPRRRSMTNTVRLIH